MSTDSTAREVFEEVDPDPDAVLEAYGARTPEELVAGGGDHEPTIDEELDADEAAADALFGDLSENSLDASEPEQETGSRSEADSPQRPESESESAPVPAIDWSGDSETSIDADIVVIEPSVTVRENDGRAVERDGTVLERVLEGDPGETVAARVSRGLATNSTVNGGSSPNVDTGVDADTDTDTNSDSPTRPPSTRSSGDDLTLVGPEPEAVRIDNAAFGAESDDFVWFGDSSLSFESDW